MERVMERNRRSWPFIVVVVGVLLITVLIVGFLGVKHRLERASIRMLLTDLRAYAVDNSGQFDADVYDHSLVVLEDSQDGVLDPDTSRMVLSVIQQRLYAWGFRTIKITPGEKQALMQASLTVLTTMTGEDFGQDVSKWRDWAAEKGHPNFRLAAKASARRPTLGTKRPDRWVEDMGRAGLWLHEHRKEISDIEAEHGVVIKTNGVRDELVWFDVTAQGENADVTSAMRELAKLRPPCEARSASSQ
jgi:hypothetical protein